MIVHLIDGTYELFRYYYGLQRHSPKTEGRKKLVDRAAELFEDGRKRKAAAEAEVAAEELYAQIGRLKMEVEWLKKKSAQLP